MYRRRLFRVALILTAVTAVMLVFLLRTGRRDYQEYEEILRAANPEAFSNELDVEVGRQQREGVEKNIWFSEENDRLHLRLISESSELLFSSYGRQQELLEHLDGVQITMQEALYWLTPDGKKASRQPDGRILVEGADPNLPSSWYKEDDPALVPMQRIRYLEADRGVQNYTDNLFTAEQVTLSRYLTTGHTLTDDLQAGQVLMKGLARSIDFSLGGGSIQFRAHQFKATFFDEGGTL